MNQLPITLGFLTTTRGHFKRLTDWRLTLNHWDRQIPLSLFNLVAHVKIGTSDEERALGDSMAAELRERGFHVLTTVGDWKRGANHGQELLRDHCTISRCDQTYRQPYFLLLEDDNLAVPHAVSLEDLLLQSCQLLADNRELLTARLKHRQADRGPTVDHPKPDPRYFYSCDTGFQPLLLRSLHFDALCQTLERNPVACQQMHCEMLWRVCLDQFSRSPFKHIVWEPDHAESVHIGCPTGEHEALVSAYNLK